MKTVFVEREKIFLVDSSRKQKSVFNEKRFYSWKIIERIFEDEKKNIVQSEEHEIKREF